MFAYYCVIRSSQNKDLKDSNALVMKKSLVSIGKDHLLIPFQSFSDQLLPFIRNFVIGNSEASVDFLEIYSSLLLLGSSPGEPPLEGNKELVLFGAAIQNQRHWHLAPSILLLSW